MKIVTEAEYSSKLKNALIEANFNLREDIRDYLSALREKINDPDRKASVEIFVENAACAAKENRAVCQDTGYVELFVDLGGDVRLEFDLRETTGRVVAEVYDAYKLRKSIAHPVTRLNTKTNAPAFLDVELTVGDTFKVSVLLKGGGSENSAKAGFLLPTDGEDRIVDWVVDHVRAVGSKSCPPYLIGVAVGGTLAESAKASKKLLLERMGSHSGDEIERRLEEKILTKTNELPIGFQGLRFGETVLSVRVKAIPCHIATLPIAVAIGCNAVRQVEFEI